MTKANYPEWVMKYKSKGVYINKVGNTYYLYRAHSVYVKETKKVRRVSDGYIGRVTEKDGFIPTKDKVQGDIFVYEYGLFIFLSSLLKDVYKSLNNNSDKDSILALAIMTFLDYNSYYDCGLFHIYKKSKIECFDRTTIISESMRICRMLDHFIQTRVDDNDWAYLKTALTSIHLVKVNNKLYISSYSDKLKCMLDKYHVEVK